MREREREREKYEKYIYISLSLSWETLTRRVSKLMIQNISALLWPRGERLIYFIILRLQSHQKSLLMKYDNELIIISSLV